LPTLGSKPLPSFCASPEVINGCGTDVTSEWSRCDVLSNDAPSLAPTVHE
jgi:hypothetical protein